jgi:hypothetical protein
MFRRRGKRALSAGARAPSRLVAANDVPSIETSHPIVRGGRSHISYFGYSETKVKLDF